MKLDNIQVDTVVVGAGQAGVAMSEHLTALGISHLVIEKIVSQKRGEADAGTHWLQMVHAGMIVFQI